jgi:CubicO group peptidase (beta-lactamase class C family)
MRVDEKDLRAALEESLPRHRVPGASVAVFSEGCVSAAAVGVTNVNTGVEMTSDTIMHIGSIAKVFNATLLMQLVDEGRVQLDEAVVRYLPNLRLRDREALNEITVKMLLNHSSGIDGPMLPDYGHDEETIEKAVKRFSELGQIHSPGTEYSYCNAATVIAGYLAQQLTTKSWYRLLRERIFEPLQMEHSATLPEEALLHRAGVGHYLARKPTEKLVSVSRMFLPLSFAPGGTSLMMSAVDLIQFTRAHMQGGIGANGARILSESSTKAMQQITVNNKDKGYTYADGIGLGWMLFKDGLLHHSGGGPGIASVLYAHPEREFAAAILTNAEFALSWNLINEMMDRWFKEAGIKSPASVVNVRSPSKHSSIDSNRYLGVYENGTNRYQVSATPDGLALSAQAKVALYDYTSLEPTPPAPLVPRDEDKFLLASEGSNQFGGFAFRNVDSDGRMQHLGNSDRLYRRVSP